MTKQTKFAIAVIVQLLIIFTIIIFKMAVLTGGTEVLLKIEPVDPRDPFRGDYVTFRYEISNIDSYYFPYPDKDNLKEGDTVYIPLEPRGKYWNVTYYRASRKKPTDQNQVFIKGKVLSVSNYNVRIKYGIEEYFIEEGKGRGFSFWDKEVSATVVLDEDGNSVLKQLYVDDNPWP
ncbi:GDYXXLXY domain-containing protein [Patescibacteria group bacterium]